MINWSIIDVTFQTKYSNGKHRVKTAPIKLKHIQRIISTPPEFLTKQNNIDETINNVQKFYLNYP